MNNVLLPYPIYNLHKQPQGQIPFITYLHLAEILFVNRKSTP